MAGPEHSPIPDEKYHVKIGDASEASHKRLLYDIHQSERQKVEKQSSLSILKKIRTSFGNLRRGRLAAMETFKHADEYAEQQKNQNFIFAGSELARTSFNDAKAASRDELAAMVEQVGPENAVKADEDIEDRIHGLIADYVQADPPMSDEQFEEAQLKFLQNLRDERPDMYEKTSVFANNIHSIAQQVKADYEIHKEVISDDKKIKDLIVSLGGEVQGGLDTDVNRDMIVKGYNMIARSRGGRVASKFINPATMGLMITFGPKIFNVSSRAALGFGTALSAGIGALKGYVNAEADLADATIDMATGKYKPGEKKDSRLKEVGKNTGQYLKGNVPKHELEKHVIEQLSVTEQVDKINDLLAQLKTLEKGKSPDVIVSQLRQEVAEAEARTEVSREIARDLWQYEDEYKINAGRAAIFRAITTAKVELKKHGVDRDKYNKDFRRKLDDLRQQAGDKRRQYRMVKAKMMVVGGVKSAAITYGTASVINLVANEVKDMDLSRLEAVVATTRNLASSGMAQVREASPLVSARVAHGSAVALSKMGLYETASAQGSLIDGIEEAGDDEFVPTGRPNSPIDEIVTTAGQESGDMPPSPYSGDYVGYPEGVGFPEVAPYEGYPQPIEAMSEAGDKGFPEGYTEGVGVAPYEGFPEQEGPVEAGTIGGVDVEAESDSDIGNIESTGAVGNIDEVSHQGNVATGDGTSPEHNYSEHIDHSTEMSSESSSWESIENRIKEPRDTSHDRYITHGTPLVGEHNELDIQYKVQDERIVIDVTGMEHDVDYDGDGQPDLPKGTQLYGVFYLTEADHAQGREIRVPLVDGKLVLSGENKDLAGLFKVENGQVTQQFERFSVAHDNGDGSFTFHASNEGHDIKDGLIEKLKSDGKEVVEPPPGDNPPYDDRKPAVLPPEVDNPPYDDRQPVELPPEGDNHPYDERVAAETPKTEYPPSPPSGPFVGYPPGVEYDPHFGTPDMVPHDERIPVERDADGDWYYGPIGVGRVKPLPLVPSLIAETGDGTGEEEKVKLHRAEFNKKERPVTEDEKAAIAEIIEQDELDVARAILLWPILENTEELDNAVRKWLGMTKTHRRNLLENYARYSDVPAEPEEEKDSEKVELSAKEIAWVSDLTKTDTLTVDEVVGRYPALKDSAELSSELDDLVYLWPSLMNEDKKRERLEKFILKVKKATASSEAEEADSGDRKLSPEEVADISRWSAEPRAPSEILDKYPDLADFPAWETLKGRWSATPEDARKSTLKYLIERISGPKTAEDVPEIDEEALSAKWDEVFGSKTATVEAVWTDLKAYEHMSRFLKVAEELWDKESRDEFLSYVYIAENTDEVVRFMDTTLSQLTDENKFRDATNEELQKTVEVWVTQGTFPRDEIIAAWPFAKDDPRMDTLERDWKNISQSQQLFRLISISRSRPEGFVYSEKPDDADEEKAKKADGGDATKTDTGDAAGGSDDEKKGAAGEGRGGTADEGKGGSTGGDGKSEGRGAGASDSSGERERGAGVSEESFKVAAEAARDTTRDVMREFAAVMKNNQDREVERERIRSDAATEQARIAANVETSRINADSQKFERFMQEVEQFRNEFRNQANDIQVQSERERAVRTADFAAAFESIKEVSQRAIEAAQEMAANQNEQNRQADIDRENSFNELTRNLLQDVNQANSEQLGRVIDALTAMPGRGEDGRVEQLIGLLSTQLERQHQAEVSREERQAAQFNTFTQSIEQRMNQWAEEMKASRDTEVNQQILNELRNIQTELIQQLGNNNAELLTRFTDVIAGMQTMAGRFDALEQQLEVVGTETAQAFAKITTLEEAVANGFEEFARDVAVQLEAKEEMDEARYSSLTTQGEGLQSSLNEVKAQLDALESSLSGELQDVESSVVQRIRENIGQYYRQLELRLTAVEALLEKLGQAIEESGQRDWRELYPRRIPENRPTLTDRIQQLRNDQGGRRERPESISRPTPRAGFEASGDVVVERLPISPSGTPEWWYRQYSEGIKRQKGVEEELPLDKVKENLINLMDGIAGEKIKQDIDKRNQFKERVHSMIDDYISKWESGQSTAAERYNWLVMLRNGLLTADIAQI